MAPPTPATASTIAPAASVATAVSTTASLSGPSATALLAAGFACGDSLLPLGWSRRIGRSVGWRWRLGRRRFWLGHHIKVVDQPAPVLSLHERDPNGGGDESFVVAAAAMALHEQQHGRAVSSRGEDGAVGHPVFVDHRVTLLHRLLLLDQLGSIPVGGQRPGPLEVLLQRFRLVGEHVGGDLGSLGASRGAGLLGGPTGQIDRQ